MIGADSFLYEAPTPQLGSQPSVGRSRCSLEVYVETYVLKEASDERLPRAL